MGGIVRVKKLEEGCGLDNPISRIDHIHDISESTTVF